MKLLAIDTSGPVCSAALLCHGGLTERSQLAPRRHAELILPMMDELLADAGLRLADLDALAFARGPGSFTGVRIAAAVAQGAAFGARLPLLPVSTLAALAQGGARRHGARRLLPALDARMGELYWGGYVLDQDGIARCVLADQVAPPGAVSLPTGAGWIGVGSGWQTWEQTLRTRLGPALAEVLPALDCQARDVAVLAAAAWAERQRAGAEPQPPHPEEGLPVYLRDRVAVAKGRLAGD